MAIAGEQRSGEERSDAGVLARRLCEAVPLIAHVVVTGEPDGRAALLRLDPLLVDARAGQQGLADRSIAAAAADPRVRRMLADAVARVNADCAPQQRIARFSIAD